MSLIVSRVISRSAGRGNGVCMDSEAKVIERALKIFLSMDFFLRLGERSE